MKVTVRSLLIASPSLGFEKVHTPTYVRNDVSIVTTKTVHFWVAECPGVTIIEYLRREPAILKSDRLALKSDNSPPLLLCTFQSLLLSAHFSFFA